MEGTASFGYVRWEEAWVSCQKGRREVHYYLKRRDGTSDLAVVGKEKSLRHISYHYAVGTQKLLASMRSSLFQFKLKSRREVIEWLDSIVSDSSATNLSREADAETLKDNQLHKLGHSTKEFLWLGTPWTCKKRRKHYQSFRRNGFKISVYDFVYVLAEEGKRLVAYLEDMYEDSRGNRMVVVRWFHKIDEVGTDLPQGVCDREVFLSLYLQDLSIECIDGLATVLSPQHYEKFQTRGRYTLWEPFICSKQFDNDDVKPFDVTQLKGYWKQEITRFIFTLSESKANGSFGMSDDSQEDFHSTASGIPKKRRRLTKVGNKDASEFAAVKLENLNNNKTDIKDSTGNIPLNKDADHYLLVGSQVEVLSQDSGIRGCWFRASVLKKHKNKVKVQYQDIEDAVDETKKLEEWVLASRITAQDHLGLWMSGRAKIRPASPSHKFEKSLGDVGSIVDVWWHDGWWEGIIVEIESDAKYHVYFPGEKLVSDFGLDNLRPSQEWIGNEWVNMRERPDLVTSILSTLETKQDPCKSHDSKSTVLSAGEDAIQSNQGDAFLDSEKDEPRKSNVFPDLLKDAILSQLRWKTSRKRRRGGGVSCGKQKYDDKDRKKALESDASESDGFIVQSSLNAEHDEFKYRDDPSVFSSSVVPSLTNMVMCR